MMISSDFTRPWGPSVLPAINLLTLFLIAAFIVPALASKDVFPGEALKMLMDGNDRFVAGKPANPNTGPDRVALCGTEDQGDHAYATILACSDSRVPVERIFDAGFMDLFVVRVAGNVCDTDEIGTIEYGLCHVNTPLLVILGHTQCGAVTAVTAACEGHGHALERNIPALVDNIGPAVKTAMAKHPGLKGKDLVHHGIIENVWQGIRDLFVNSPAVRNLVKRGRVKVTGAIYDVASGKVVWLPASRVEGIFEEVEADPKRAMNAMAQAPADHEMQETTTPMGYEEHEIMTRDGQGGGREASVPPTDHDTHEAEVPSGIEKPDRSAEASH